MTTSLAGPPVTQAEFPEGQSHTWVCSPLTGAPMEVLNWSRECLDYTSVWETQRAFLTEIAQGNRPDTLLLLQHDAVFTAGSSTQENDRPRDAATVIDVDRGGRITWHGPGQLVGYPLVRLGDRLRVVEFVRAVEELLMSTLAKLGLETTQVPDRSGVWTKDQPTPSKVAAIGIRVSQAVTMHGFAINCNCDLSWVNNIVPCGIADAGVTSIAQETGRQVTPWECADLLIAEMCQ